MTTKKISRECDNCKKIFEYNKKEKARKYCTYECFLKTKRHIKTCLQCHKEFEVINSLKRQKLCSKSCSLSYTKKGNKYCVGRKMSLETRQKIGNAQIGRIPSTQEREKKSIASKKAWAGLKKTEYYTNMINEMKKGKALSMRKKAKYNKESSIEKIVENYLLFNDILYVKQYVYKCGIADFWLPDNNVIIEVDGLYWHSKPEVLERDIKQTKWLEDNEYIVIRIPENEVHNCMLYIEEAI